MFIFEDVLCISLFFRSNFRKQLFLLFSSGKTDSQIYDPSLAFYKEEEEGKERKKGLGDRKEVGGIKVFLFAPGN